MGKTEEPKGIAFFSIKSGDTHYAKLEPQIQAYINSSDMGINASRGQDFGWRLAPEWVKAVKAFRRDNNRMSVLAAKNGGGKVTTTQVLYALYDEQVREFQDVAEQESNPFEEQYLQNISNKGTTNAKASTDTGDDSENTSEPNQEELVTATSNKSSNKTKASSKKQ